MLVNSDFFQRVSMTPDQYDWVASPQQGVERVMLDRVGGEVARATSIVRYAPGSDFPRHQHPGGEEILVMSGTFSSEDGDYPTGWYLRNPPGSSHAPSSAPGTTIFVKLFQMNDGERAEVRVDTRDPSNWKRTDGRDRCELFVSPFERVALERVAADELVVPDASRGAELLVLDGDVSSSSGTYGPGSWVRMPPGDAATFRAGLAGAAVYLKTGHLQQAVSAP
jgi:anti-sigma factor ChrR (cupin superfamily)